METAELLKIQELFEKLERKIDALEPIIEQQAPSQSAEIKDIATALAKAQAEMPVADLNKNNP